MVSDDQPGRDSPMDGRARVRALVAACGGYAAAMRATGIAHSTLAGYLRAGVITSAQHVVALCRAAGWSTGMVEPLVGLPADGAVEPRHIRGPRLRAALAHRLVAALAAEGIEAVAVVVRRSE